MQSVPIRRAILFFVIAMVFQIETLLVAPREDSAAWLFMGQRQSHGQMPGRDLWDNKLPLIYLIGRAAMAIGRPQAFLWLLEAGVTAIGALAVCAIVRTASCSATLRGGADRDWAAACAGALFCVVSGSPSFHGGGFLTEIYATTLSAVAVYLSCRGIRQSGRVLTPIVAGLFWALAVSFRLPLGLASVVVVGSLAAVGRSATQTGNDGLVGVRPGRYVGLHLGGALIGGLLVLVHPMAAGYVADCFRAAVLWPLGAVAGRGPAPMTAPTLERLADFAQDIAKLGWLHIASVGGVVLSFRRGSRTLAIVVATWYAAALGSAALGWASYAHYQYVAFAPMAVAIALLLVGLEARASRRTAAVLVGVTAIVVGVQNVRGFTRARPGGDEVHRAAVVAFVEAHTAPTDSVLIWAWGRSADLLYRIDRSPGVRHFLAHAYLIMDVSLFDEMVDEFLTRPPAWIVEDSLRNKPPLTAAAEANWSWTSPALQRLQSFARAHYTQEARIGQYLVLRFDGASPTGTGLPHNNSVEPSS